MYESNLPKEHSLEREIRRELSPDFIKNGFTQPIAAKSHSTTVSQFQQPQQQYILKTVAQPPRNNVSLRA